MRQELLERLEILRSAEMIDEEISTFCVEVVNYFLKLSSEWPQENMEIFITHLAMAASRSKRGETENSINDSILESLREESVFEEAESILNFILQLTNIKFPVSEVDLLLIHICNMCKIKKGE